jgi:hypothetical protein
MASTGVDGSVEFYRLDCGICREVWAAGALAVTTATADVALLLNKTGERLASVLNLSNVDGVTLLPQIPGGKNYLDLQ